MTEQTLPKSLRLRRRGDFSRVQRQGARGSAVSLQAVVRKGRGRGRFGLTVPKKVGNAVVRNRTKRRLREILRRDRDLYVGIDLVVICQAGAGDLDFAGLEEQLRAAVARARSALDRQKARGNKPQGRSGGQGRGPRRGAERGAGGQEPQKKPGGRPTGAKSPER